MAKAKKSAGKAAKKTAKKTRKPAAGRMDRKPAKKTAAKTARTIGRKKSVPQTKPSKKVTHYETEESKLMKLFEDELKDIYWAEKALTKALPKMIKNATSPDLKEAIQNHLEETEEQVRNVERVFQLVGKKVSAKKCEAMNGLLKEAEEIMKECEKGSMRDAGIISAAQKVEHYEIATYGTLKTFALTMGNQEAADVIEEILNQEKNADLTLTGIAEAGINVKASEQEEGEEEKEETPSMSKTQDVKELENELVDVAEGDISEEDDNDENSENDEE
jgi:ferritin-like metal-binding protein YciE